MSGLSRDERTFSLTPTKASYWHRLPCPCSTMDDFYRLHLQPAGFRRVAGAKYLDTYEHPDHARFPDGLLWEALSGRPSSTGDIDTRFA